MSNIYIYIYILRKVHLRLHLEQRRDVGNRRVVGSPGQRAHGPRRFGQRAPHSTSQPARRGCVAGGEVERARPVLLGAVPALTNTERDHCHLDAAVPPSVGACRLCCRTQPACAGSDQDRHVRPKIRSDTDTAVPT